MPPAQFLTAAVAMPHKLAVHGDVAARADGEVLTVIGYKYFCYGKGLAIGDGVAEGGKVCFSRAGVRS